MGILGIYKKCEGQRELRDQSVLPNKLLFSIGSYAVSRVSFQWDGKQLIYQVNNYGGFPGKNKS